MEREGSHLGAFFKAEGQLWLGVAPQIHGASLGIFLQVPLHRSLGTQSCWCLSYCVSCLQSNHGSSFKP